MPQLLAQHDFELEDIALGGGQHAPTTFGDPRLVRDELRRQIAGLERRLGELWATAFPRRGIDWTVGAAGGPRVLGVADLERVRDALVVRVREAQTEIARRADVEEANRNLVERMIADPEEHHWVRVSNEDVGERECKHWHSRPRWGVLGLLLNWWRVKVSSGCPLAKGPRPPRMASKKRKKRRPRRPAAAPVENAAPAPAAAQRRRTRGFAAAADERPPAPWGSFPLVEIAILVGLVILLVGLIGGGDRAPLLIGIGLGLAGLGGLELAIREHFAGFRSHSALLGAIPAVAVMALLFYTETLEPGVRVGVALAVFVASAFGLAAMFRRKAGVAIKLR